MKRIYLIILCALFFCSAQSQTIAPSPTKFINGLGVPTQSSPFSGEGFLRMMSGRLNVHNGTLYQAYLSMVEAASLYEPIANKVTSLSSPNNTTFPTTQAVADAIAGASSGVTSIIGTSNQIIASAPNGNVTLTLPQNIGTGSTPTFGSVTTKKFILNDIGGSARDYAIQTAGVDRWFIRGGTTAETGSNAGTPLQIIRRGDDGLSLGTALSISRATGAATFENTVNATTFAGGTTTAAVGTNTTQLASTAFVNTAVLGVNTLSSASTLTLSTRGFYKFTGTTSTWTLPPLTGNTGNRYTLVNRGTGTITLNSNAGANDIDESGIFMNTFPISSGSSITIYCDGVKWIILD